jgi:hypothetical protein
MASVIKGWKVMLLTREGKASGFSPEQVGWQDHPDPDIRDGLLIIKNGLNTHGVPICNIHGFSIEAVRKSDEESTDNAIKRRFIYS